MFGFGRGKSPRKNYQANIYRSPQDYRALSGRIGGNARLSEADRRGLLEELARYERRTANRRQTEAGMVAGLRRPVNYRPTGFSPPPSPRTYRPRSEFTPPGFSPPPSPRTYRPRSEFTILSEPPSPATQAKASQNVANAAWEHERRHLPPGVRQQLRDVMGGPTSEYELWRRHGELKRP